MPAARNDSPFVFGNKKLPKTTAVLNITPAALCPSRILGLCQLKNPDKECYALREERVYPGCIPSRMKMMEYWDRSTPWTIAKDLLALNETKQTKISALRIGECGDFRHQADLEKAETLAHFLDRSGMKTYCYTARRDLCYDDVKTLVVNGSGWMANNMFVTAYSLRKAEPGFGWTAKNGSGNPVECGAVCAGNCRKCQLCQMKLSIAIAAPKH